MVIPLNNVSLRDLDPLKNIRKSTFLSSEIDQVVLIFAYFGVLIQRTRGVGGLNVNLSVRASDELFRDVGDLPSSSPISS